VKLRNPEHLARIWLLLVYAFACVYYLPHWQLSNDDGIALQAARDFFAHLSWWGPRTATGILHPPFVYAFYAVFLGGGTSVLALQLALVALSLAAHWLLIEVLLPQRGAPVAYAASLLAFTNPTQFALMGQRFWEPAVLPVLVTAALACFLAASERRSWRGYAACLGLLLLATGAHYSVYCFYPVVLLGIFQSGGLRQWGRGPAGTLLALVFASFAPVLFALHGRTDIIRLAVAGSEITLILLVLAWNPPAVLRNAIRKIPWWGGLFAIPLALSHVEGIRSQLDAFGSEARVNIGAPLAGVEWLSWVLPCLAVLGIVRMLRDGRARSLLLWLLAPVAALSVVRLSYFPTYYFNFLFPAFFVFCAEGLLNSIQKPRAGLRNGVAVFAVLVLVILQACSTWAVEEMLASTGGVGEHTATLGTKQRVVRAIFAEAPRAGVTLMSNLYRRGLDRDYEAWRFLLGGVEEQPARYFYIAEPRAPAYDEGYRENLRRTPEVRTEQIGSVLLYSTGALVGETGVRLR
jgi:hypothetical protein